MCFDSSAVGLVPTIRLLEVMISWEKVSLDIVLITFHPASLSLHLFSFQCPKDLQLTTHLSTDWPAVPPQPDNDPMDYFGHGTHVAGIILGKSDQ
jgi:subtilisin family serine protease